MCPSNRNGSSKSLYAFCLHLSNYNLGSFHATVKAVASVSDRWRPLRCMTQRRAPGLHYPSCFVNGHTGAWYGTRPGGCVCSEDCGREGDTRAPSSPRTSTSLTPTKVPNTFFSFAGLPFVDVVIWDYKRFGYKREFKKNSSPIETHFMNQNTGFVPEPHFNPLNVL